VGDGVALRGGDAASVLDVDPAVPTTGSFTVVNLIKLVLIVQDFHMKHRKH
jgi:hypothetical protein